MTINSYLDNLGEEQAKVVLATFAKAAQQGGSFITSAEPDMLATLRDTFPDAPAETDDVSEYDLCRAGLELLAADEAHGPAIQALAEGPRPERFFGVIGTAAVITGVLLVLQTHVRIERTPSGRYRVFVEKKPTNVKLLETVVSKFLGFLGG